MRLHGLQDNAVRRIARSVARQASNVEGLEAPITLEYQVWPGDPPKPIVIQNQEALDTLVEAALWLGEEWERRTVAVEDGTCTDIYWVGDEQRVGWTDVHSRFPRLLELLGVDARLALEGMKNKLGIELREIQ